MSTYYGIYALVSNDELEHHGIKGQKWGVRRFQNEDGTLTAEGMARYGNKKDYSDKKGSLVKAAVGGNFASRAINGDSRYHGLTQDFWQKRYENAKASGNEKKAEKAERRLEAQKAFSSDMEAYREHTSTGKMIVQDLLLTRSGANSYRRMRAMGEGRIASLLETATLPGYAVGRLKTRKRYGSALAFDGVGDGNEL